MNPLIFDISHVSYLIGMFDLIGIMELTYIRGGYPVVEYGVSCGAAPASEKREIRHTDPSRFKCANVYELPGFHRIDIEWNKKITVLKN